jgi:hypothetical protein
MIGASALHNGASVGLIRRGACARGSAGAARARRLALLSPDGRTVTALGDAQAGLDPFDDNLESRKRASNAP